MRPKFVITVLLLALMILGLIEMVSQAVRLHGAKEVHLSVESPSPDSSPTNNSGVHAMTGIASSEALLPRLNATLNANHSQPISERIAQLQELASNDDTNSLNEILLEITNPNPQLRKAARDAVVQFGSQAAIPRLQEIAEQTEDAGEKADLLASIEFLRLPSLTDYKPSSSNQGKPDDSNSTRHKARRKPSFL